MPHIFPDSIKRQCPVRVCDFIERYAAECLSWNVKSYPLFKKMSDDKVLFLEGEIQSLFSLPDTFQFSLTRYNDQVYEAVWTYDSTLLRMVFPIQYELILGKTKRELEQEMEEAILDAKDTGDVATLPLEPLADSSIYCTMPQQHYEIPEMTNICFYRKESGGYYLILDTNYIEYSIRNVVLSPSEFNPLISVTQLLYGHRKKNYTMTLEQWHTYCRQENLTVYAGLKTGTVGYYEAVIIAENKDIAYTHMLTMSIPNNFLNDEKAVWKAKVRSFIPTHNIKNMYKQYKQ
ncbi:MAG: hypothetical protein IJT51_00865 [Bacteroidales bacterium]|nr:hypothetical protein [Bacteroidales bacterium]